MQFFFNEFAKFFAEKLSIKCLFIWLTVVTCCLPVAETVSNNFEDKKNSTIFSKHAISAKGMEKNTKENNLKQFLSSYS
jgi:hypothetical protein